MAWESEITLIAEGLRLHELAVFEFPHPIYNATCLVALRTLVMRRTSNRDN
jgi:hypothetical protein